MNSVEFLDAYPRLQQSLLNSKFFDIIPGGFSIATDISCKTILHNPITAQFLRIEPWGQEVFQAKVYHCRRPIAVEDLPLQRAARYGEIIDRFELEFVWEDGISKIAQWSAHPLRDENGNICGAIATMIDVTDMVMKLRKLDKYKTELEELVEKRSSALLNETKQREQVEQDAKKLEEQFQAAIDLIPDGFGIFSQIQDGDGKVIDFRIDNVNEAHCNRAKMNKNQLIGRRLSELINNTPLLETYCNVADTGVPMEREQTYYSNGVGTTIDFASMGRAVKIPNGLAVLWRDITARKHSEESLRVSEERFSKAFYSSPYMKSIIAVADSQYVCVNEAFLQGFQYTLAEVIGKTPVDLGSGPKKMALFLNTFNQDNMVRNLEIKMTRKNGDQVDVLLSSVPIIFNGQQCILNEYVDITELKKVQLEVARLDRLKLVGQMAAGIGHEIRNPMTTVSGYLQLLREKQQYEPLWATFDLLIGELDMANTIITEFLTLARNQATKTAPQNLNQVLANIFPLLETNALSQSKQIEFKLEEIPNINLNVKEIHQLVLNLCQNGFESMNEQGCLTVRTYLEGENVVLSVQDEGCGINSENLGKLGTPFFTTKDCGTGLGLATCYSIAAHHNAQIQVDTGNQGTTFLVSFLPITSENGGPF